MQLGARFLDARNAKEGKGVSILLSALLTFSFLNVSMFTDFAGAAEGEDALKEVEVSQLENQIADTTAEELADNEAEDKASDASAFASQRSNQQKDTDITPQSTEQTEENPTKDLVTFDEATGVLTIKNKDVIDSSDVSQWKRTAKELVLEDIGSISKEAFAEFKIESATIKNVKHIGYSFRSCTALKCLEIDGVGTIDQFAFYNPANLEEVAISNVEEIGKNAFNVYGGATKLNKVSLANVTNIADQAFKDHSELTELSFDNVGTIGFQAFMNCSKLGKLVLSGKVSAIGTSAFLGCKSLSEINIDGVEVGNTAFYGCTGITKVVLKNIQSVGSQAFTGCTGLETVEISDVETIGNMAFSVYGDNVLPACTSLATLKMTNVDHIGKNAFYKCTNLKEVDLTNVTFDQADIYDAEKGIFYPPFKAAGTKGMTLTVKDSDLGGYAFSGCAGLTTATISNVKSIGQYAFKDCTGLTTATINNIDVIEQYAFWNCSNLSTVDSLRNVSDRIGGFAFYGCKNLKGLTVEDMTKMGYNGSIEMMERMQNILAGKFKMDSAEKIEALTLGDRNYWIAGALDQSDNWNQYDNGTQLMEQARWQDVNSGVAEVKVDAYYTGEKQMDYIFVADLSASMAQLGNPKDENARFYDMQSKLLDMTGSLLNTPGYDCQVALVTFGGLHNDTQTCSSLDFTQDANDAESYIKALEPLNENTDYGLGLKEALKLIQGHKGRNTALVFLSDGYPTANGSGDQYGTDAAAKIKAAGVPIYGVLHSPASGSRDTAMDAMKGVCGDKENVYESTNTEQFGKAMNAAFAAVYGTNTVTVPVNAAQFNMGNISASAGSVQYDENNGIIVWTLEDMPFAQHTLTYTMALKDDLLNQVGTNSYRINNGGNATFGKGGASVGINLMLSRTVNDPAAPSQPTTPSVPNVPGPAQPTTPANPTTPAPTTTPAATTTPTTVVTVAPAAIPAAAPVVTPEAEEIEDNATPQAVATSMLREANEPESISEDETPMGAFDEPHCWVHWVALIGVLLTVIYGVAVVRRRLGMKDELEDMEKYVLGVEESAAEPMTAASRQAL